MTRQSKAHKIGKVFLYKLEERKRIRVKISKYEHNTPIDTTLSNGQWHMYGNKFWTYTIEHNDWTMATEVTHE